MKIALIGYGKMGRAIEEIAQNRGHEIIARIDKNNQDDFTQQNLQEADVAIEFTAPESAYVNLHLCLEWGIPTISGSTGWTSKLPEIENFAREKNGTFLYASNFSLGVNIFFKLNKYLARMMEKFPEYNVSMTEIHHTEKKDAPSGTAITLADQIIEYNANKNKWVKGRSDVPDELGILSKRIDDVPGTHSIFYNEDIDEIMIQHTAFSRKGFAQGAVRAAEFVADKKGIYTMEDVLGLDM